MGRSLKLGFLAAMALLITVAATNAALRTASQEKVLGASGGSAAGHCQRGSEAVSGGFANPDFDPSGGGSQFLPVDSRRKGDRVFKTAVVNEESESGTFVAYAYCDRHEPGLVTRTNTIVVPTNELGSVKAKCPRGGEAVSGGFASPDFSNVSTGSEVFPVASKRARTRQWKATGYNGGEQSGRLTALAYCDKGEPGLTTKSKDATIEGGSTGSVTAKCPRGREAVAGGFDGNFKQLVFQDSGAVTFTSKRTKTRGWKASGFDGLMGSAKLTAFAYCER